MAGGTSMLAGKVAKGDPVLDAFGRHSWQNSQDTESQRKWHQRQCWGFDPLSQKHVLLLADMAKAVGGRVQGKRWNTQDWRCPETPPGDLHAGWQQVEGQAVGPGLWVKGSL